MAKWSQILVDKAENPLVTAFNDESMSDNDFEKMLADADKTSVNFKLFSRKVRKIEMEESEPLPINH